MRRRNHKTLAKIERPVSEAKVSLGSSSRNDALPVMRYDGAGYGRRMGSWIAPASGPNSAISQIQTLRNRARDAIRNEWEPGSALESKVSNLVGTGIIPRLPKTVAPTLKKKLDAFWESFCGYADADGVSTLYGLQALGTRTFEEAGEYFIRVRPRKPGIFEIPLQFQLLEPEMVPMYDSTNYITGNRIRSGIEIDRVGKRVAYWVCKEHPGDEGFSGGTTDLVRVSADLMYHVYRPLRIGQLRGVPGGAANLARLRTVTDADDAIVARMHTANLFTGFISRPMPPPDGIDADTGKALLYDDDNVPMASMEPGTMQDLLPGETVTFNDPPDAGPNYEPFMRAQILGLAAGDNVPYELVTGDLRGISDRALRVVLNEFRRKCQQKQWTILIPALQWMRDKWVDTLYLAGLITQSQIEIARDVTWAPHAWAYVNPVQDVAAKQAEVDGGFRSRSSVIAEAGDDPAEVDNERADDKEREDELGLVSGAAAKASPVKEAPPAASPSMPNPPMDPPTPDPEKAKAQAILESTLSMLERSAGVEAKGNPMDRIMAMLEAA